MHNSVSCYLQETLLKLNIPKITASSRAIFEYRLP